MKKIFLLIPVLAFALMTKADVISITPTSPYDDHDNLRLALHYANDGDIIEMGGGIYEESNENYIALDAKNVIVRAAAGQNVIIKPHVPFTISGGARAEIQGVKIDASELCSLSSYSHLMYPSDDAANNRLILDGCEIYGYAEGKAVIASRGSNKLDSLTINNCKFYNHTTRSCVFLENTENKGLVITNSTFYNIATSTADFNAGIIDNRNASAKVRFDHCTFYNVIPMNTDYSCVSKITLSDGIVSNCIFMLPSAQDGVRAMRGVIANNCLTYNYIKDNGTGIHSSVTQNNCFQADPLFADAANGDFSLAGNWITMNLSPARGAATDGFDLGDPRWAVAETLPSTDFASAYDLLGTKALLSGNIELNESDHIKYKGSQVAGSAKWKLHISRACAIGAVADREAESTSGCTLTLTAYDADGNEVSAITAARSDNDNDINFPGCLYIPEEGDYTIILTNSVEYSGAILEKITLSYMGGAVQAMPGTTDIDEAWFIGGTRADGKITFTSGHVNDGWAKWNVSFASAANYNVYLNVNSGNGKKFTVALQDANGNDVVPSLYLNGGAQGTPVALEMGAMEVPAGSYILKVTNAEAWSDAEILSVTFAYAGGAAIDLSKTTPASLLANADAILSDDWSIDAGKIVHPESKALTGWAKWNVDCADAANYNVTVNISSDNGHLMKVEVFEGENNTAIHTLNETSATQYHTGDQAINLGNIALEDKEYVFKVSNTGEYSHVQIASIVITYVGGAVVNIPTAEIPLVDAIRSTRAFIDAEGLHFTDAEHLSTISDEWAKWNIAVASEGLYKFTAHCSSTNYSNLTIAVYDGETELYTYTPQYTYKQDDKEISSPEWLLEAGNYVLKLSNPANNSNGYLLSLSASVADNIIILDEMAMDNSVIHANNGENAKKIMIKRTFVAGMYNTICLPFSDWNSSLELIFGTGYELLELESAELEGDVLNLMFNSVTELGHGRPYLIKPTQDVVNPIFGTGHTIDERTDGYNVKSCTNADFIGSFIKGEVPAGEDNLFLGPDNTLYFSNSATPIKGFRAYFQVKVPNPQQVIKRANIVTKPAVPTNIGTVNSQEPAKTQKLLRDGQLIIIRDGVQYNAFGVKVK